jgi:PAS domain S-box-containing protein
MSVAVLSASEAERLAVLNGYEILDTPPEEAFDRIVRLAAALAKTPIAMISLAGEGRQWFKAVIGLPIREIPSDRSFGAVAMLDDDVLVVEDARNDWRFHGNPLIDTPHELRFFAGAPLCAPSGHRLGTLCVTDRQPRGLDGEIRRRLVDLAAMVVDVLELRATRQALTACKAGVQAERLKTSTLIQAVVDESKDPIFVKDTEGRYLLVNAAAARAMGQPPESILGRTDHDVLPPDIVPALRVVDNQVVATGRSITVEEMLPSSEGPKTYLSTKSPLLDAQGLLVGVVGIARDITARKQVECALLEAKEEACRANQAKSEFLSAMSHELRTPLNAVLGFSQMLEINTREPLTPTQRTCVGHIHRAGQHLLDLVNEILDLAKIEAGHLDLTLEPVDARRLLRESVALVMPMARPRNITIQVDEMPGALPAVHADGVRLTQVLVNLLSNAVKYNRPAGRVTVSERLSPEHRLRLTITDTGPGLSPEQLSRLFQPFDRLGAETGAVEGSGIGLVITRRLVEKMGGGIGVESRPDEGSTFWIELPHVADAPEPTASGGPTGRIFYPVGKPADSTPPRAMPARAAGDRP